MLWLAGSAVVLATASWVVVFLLWRRLRRLEIANEQVSKPPYSSERDTYDSVELTLGAMLEELEAKNQEILRTLDHRLQLIAKGDFEVRESSVKVDSPKPYPKPSPAPPTSSVAPPSYHDKYEAVHQLAAEGHDVITIAQRLGLCKGEVQLILELKRQSL